MFTPDEVAGVVDLFGALTPKETANALSELSYRRGEDPPTNVTDDAIESFKLIELEADGRRLIVPGPAAFPVLPEGGEDLPHILEVENRSIDHDVIEQAVSKRFRSAVESVITAGDRERANDLIEISYDIEAWGGPDLSSARPRLEDVTDDTN